MANFKQLQEEQQAEESVKASRKKANEERKAKREALKKVTWKQPVGNSVVRILPNPNNPDNPFIRVVEHKNDELGAKYTIAALTTFGKPDPIVEAVARLDREKDPTLREMAKKLFPKTYYYAYVLVRGQEKEGVKLWRFGKTVYKQIVELAADEDDITDLKNGIDLKIKAKEEYYQGYKYAEIELLSLDRKNSPVMPSLKEFEALSVVYPNPLDAYEEKPYEELVELLNNYLNPEGAEEAQPLDDAPVMDAPATGNFQPADRPRKAAEFTAFNDVNPKEDDLPF